MAFRVSSSIGLIACVVSMASVPGLCRAQDAKPTIDAILKVWQTRQERVRTARFELNCEETIHKGRVSFMEGARQGGTGLQPQTGPNPPRDYLVNGTSSIRLDGSRMRYSYDHQQWDPIDKKLYPEHYIDVFDGRMFKFLRNPASAQKLYPLAAVRTAKASESSPKLAIRPLILTFRGNHPQFFRDLGEYRVTGQSITVATRPCLQLVRASAGAEQRDLLYLDQERDYVVVREMILVHEAPNWQSDVTYASDAAVGWVPRSWEYIVRVGKDGRVYQSGRRTIARYDINPQLDDNDFDIPFPPTTRVVDTSSGEGIQYVVRENGEKGRGILTANNPTYEDLQKPAPRFNRGVLMAVWTAILVLALGGCMWVRRRRLLRDRPTHPEW
ncbi:MAG TPA: hypothetical protein VG013_17970 [Gemmataceae bacterium]|jgi:hypothetical protein|nr:hypothetical protein [Gemmataceae bacterium]